MNEIIFNRKIGLFVFKFSCHSQRKLENHSKNNNNNINNNCCSNKFKKVEEFVIIYSLEYIKNLKF